MFKIEIIVSNILNNTIIRQIDNISLSDNSKLRQNVSTEGIINDS